MTRELRQTERGNDFVEFSACVENLKYKKPTVAFLFREPPEMVWHNESIASTKDNTFYDPSKILLTEEKRKRRNENNKEELVQILKMRTKSKHWPMCTDYREVLSNFAIVTLYLVCIWQNKTMLLLIREQEKELKRASTAQLSQIEITVTH